MAELAGWRGIHFCVFAALALNALRYAGNQPAPGSAGISPILIFLPPLGHRLYVGHVLCATFGYAGIFCFLSASSFVLIDVMGLKPRWFGFCFSVFVIDHRRRNRRRAQPPLRVIAIGGHRCACGRPAPAAW
jgi:hypothetical protein